MANTFRLATFNCENLFSRPKIFGESKTRANQLLGYVAKLQAALHEEVYDHARIADLVQKLQGYAFINNLRGTYSAASGASEWLGTVELVRGTVDDIAVANTARVIGEIDADVICLIEIENRNLLQAFHDDLLYPRFLKPAAHPRYTSVMSIEGNDTRGIDVALMSRRPLGWMRSHIHERTTYQGQNVALFSRDCLEVQVDLGLPSGQPLHLLVNHFKSMGYSAPSDPRSDKRRRTQARRVAELASAHDLDNEFVVVAGDLNSDSSSPSLEALVNHPGLYNANLELPADQRATFRTGNQQLDYLLLSRALRSHLTAVHIERRGMYTKTKWPHYPEVTNTRTQASDHGAVVADFDL